MRTQWIGFRFIFPWGGRKGQEFEVVSVALQTSPGSAFPSIPVWQYVAVGPHRPDDFVLLLLGELLAMEAYKVLPVAPLGSDSAMAAGLEDN